METVPRQYEPDLATRLANMLHVDKTSFAATPGKTRYTMGDVIRVNRAGLEPVNALFSNAGLDLEKLLKAGPFSLNELLNTKPVKAKAAAKQKPYNRMTEDEFISFLETEPSLAGVDIKKQIGECQFWCKCHSRKATRMTIVNWMRKADRELKFDGAGKSSKSKPVSVKAEHNIAVPYPGWPMILRYHIDSIPELERNELCKLEWHELSEDVRRMIIKYESQ